MEEQVEQVSNELVPKVDRSKKKCIADRKDGQGVVEFNPKQIQALGLDVNTASTNSLRQLVYEKLGIVGISMREDKKDKKKVEKIKPKKQVIKE